jgi:hypothetical protein
MIYVRAHPLGKESQTLPQDQKFIRCRTLTLALIRFGSFFLWNEYARVSKSEAKGAEAQ